MRDYRPINEEEFKKSFQNIEREQILDYFWQYYRDYQIIIGERARSEEARRRIEGQLEILNKFRALRESADISSENKILQLLKEISQLNIMNDKLREELARIHANARKAGRKRTISDETIAQITQDRNNKMTFRQLQAKYGYSLATFHKMFSNK